MDGELVTGQGKNYLRSSTLFNPLVKPEFTFLFLSTCISHVHATPLTAEFIGKPTHVSPKVHICNQNAAELDTIYF